MHDDVSQRIHDAYVAGARWMEREADVCACEDNHLITPDHQEILGAAGYSLAVLLRLVKGMDNRIDIEADGRSWTVRDSALVISNSKYTGGKMMIGSTTERVLRSAKVPVLAIPPSKAHVPRQPP